MLGARQARSQRRCPLKALRYNEARRVQVLDDNMNFACEASLDDERRTRLEGLGRKAHTERTCYSL